MYKYLEEIQQFLENSNVLMWMLDFDLNFIWTSPAIENITGYKPEELVGNSIKTIFTKETFADVTRTIQEHVKRYSSVKREDVFTDPEFFEFKYLHKNGNEFWMDFDVAFIRDENGVATHLMGVSRSIEKQKQFEEELKLSELKYRELFQNMTEGALLADHEGNILEVNKRLLEIMGSPSAEATMQINLLTFPPIIESGVAADIIKCIQTGEIINNTGNYKSKWGKDLFLRYQVTPFVLEGEDSQKIQIIFEDITSLKRTQEKLIEAQKMDSIGNLVSGIAHDFNNMLGGILGYASIFESIEDDPEKLEFIKGINMAARRAHDLTQKLLAFGRKGKMLIEPLVVNDIINDVLDILKHTIDPKIKIRLDLCRGDCIVDGDPTQMNQLVMNLIINAIEALKNGGFIEIVTRLMEIDELTTLEDHTTLMKGKHIMISIRDNGPGISDEIQKHMWEPFFTTKESGKGLGLSTSYGIVKTHDGQISVISEIGKGTVFNVYFPMGERSLGKTEPKKVQLTKGEATVLVIDDEPIIREMMHQMFKSLGYKVLLAENGKEGKDLFYQHHKEIDIVFLDLIMPVMDGKSTFYHLIQIDPDVKVIISTGFEENEAVQTLLDLGAVDVLLKPYSLEQLSELMEKYV
jgi:PAS domain S-box-containing protein